ncbi:hypoxanthine phosphoribosyltransferase [bacterium SCN 62-11]|nr:MAG: hypoxanthine phosphoribosyltransferase [bacterium SCN 62-11]
MESQLYSREAIAARVQELGEQLSRDYSHTEPLVVVVLKGSAMFASDLLREMSISVEVDYIGTSSYGDATESSGHVRIVKDIGARLKDRDVIIIEDIVDTGLTLDYLLRTLNLREPASLKICALLDKPSRRRAQVPVDYIGFSIEDHFVIGYGLDYASRYRNLPYIGILKLEEE